jgi:prepilin signal peptidase PulO-like enzyme (type II secretory pathway)
MVLFIYLMVVVVIDIEHRLILHPVSVFGFAMGAAMGIWMHGLWDTLIGGASGFAIMLVLYYLGEGFIRLLARWRGETVDEVALGFGDVNLSGVLGLILGWPGIALGLIIAVFLGGAYSLVYMLFAILTGRYRSFAAIPYGPFLVTSAVILIYFRNALLGMW